jgi:D-aminopeptidase
MHMKLAAVIVTTALAGWTIDAQSKPRARDLGIAPGAGEPGLLDAITDVGGVRVGHVTLSTGDSVRTGVTAIVPHAGNVFRDKVPGAVFVGNAFGKLSGSTQVEELGTIETPIVLTNTLSVGAALDGVARWTVAQPGNENVRSVNGLVGETNDGTLNDIRGFHVTADHVAQAIASAKDGPVLEGAVGAGTGTIAFGWKGGIGTSSRRAGEWMVGVLVQTNFGGRLTIAGVPVWREIRPGTTGDDGLRQVTTGPRNALPLANLPFDGRPMNREMASDSSFRVPAVTSRYQSSPVVPESSADGSCMIVVATDAPLDARDLKRLAARAVFALARTGSTYSNGSGDFAIAFSTSAANRLTQTNGPQPRSILPTDAVSGLFEAALDATEEAVYNSLLQATTTTGNGRTVRALPVDELRATLKKYGR